MTMHAQAVAHLLLEARRKRERIVVPGALRPANHEEAYATQFTVEQALGLKPVAWKVGAPNATATPSAAPIYDVIASPARLVASSLIGVEAEIAAVLGRDLPARSTPYSDEEVTAAIGGICVVIEVCDSRLSDWATADDATKLADHGLNLALVVDAATVPPQSLDYAKLAVRTLVDGRVIKEGTGTHAVGNPLLLMPWLANHARTRGGLKQGTVVTLGAWLGLHSVQPGAEVVVEFPAIGRASVTLAA
jgi:2-keto-4-pentenoate hydratase